MNNLRILLASYFILCIQQKKTVKSFTTVIHKTPSVSAISKQVSRCCKNFFHELTCQLLTNQNINIGRRAWPSVTMVRKVKSNFPVCKSRLNSRVRGQFEIKSLIVRLINTTSYFLCVKKIELEPAIIWKVVTCQRITSKNLELSGPIPEPAKRSGDDRRRML